MTGTNHSLTSEDAVIAAIIWAGAQLAILQAKIEMIASESHLPWLGLMLHWWPLLMIVTGVMLLMTNREAVRESRP